MKLLDALVWGCLLSCVITLNFALSFQPRYVANSNSRPPSSTSLAVQSAAISAFVNIHESTPRDIPAMEGWAAGCGLQRAEGFQLTSTSTHEDGQDVGAMTTQPLAAGSVVLFVPNNMILSSRRAQQEFGNQDLRAVYDSFGRVDALDDIPQFYLFLKILRECEMGDLSPWFPWLNSLPRYFSTGSSMTQFCCSEALPPLVGKLANKERVRFIQFFRALKYAKFLTEGTRNNKQWAKWVFNCVYTRSFATPDGDVRIAPMADMFNHGTDTEIEIKYDEEGNCFAYAKYDIPAGSPLRMSYGDPTNPSHLFARYGFLDETSPSTFCKIMINKPTQQIIDMGYDHSKMLFYKDTGGVSPEVWDVLLYQILDRYNREDQQILYQAHMNGDHETKQSIHQKYSAQTSAALLNHIDTFLHQLDRLSSKAAGRDLSAHPRLPIIMRHNEFVRNTFWKVREAQL